MNVIQPISFVVSPELSPAQLPGSDQILPVVGNARVTSKISDLDRPKASHINTARLEQHHPIRPAFFGLASGVNPAQLDTANSVRHTLASRPLKTELHAQETPSYMFGDVSVDPRIVQNGGQFDTPTSIDRDMLNYRTSFNSGGHIIWPVGPRDGISTRVMNRNIVNLCK